VWLYIVSIAGFCVSFLIYLYFYIHRTMDLNDWSFSKTLSYYLKMQCIFPKRTSLKLKTEKKQ